MKFTVYNHKAAPDHKFQHTLIDTEKSEAAFTRLIFNACGEGLNAAFTAKAIETTAQLRALAPGQSLRLTTKWLDLALNHREVDISLTRVEG
jgi:hypothetical protein